MSTIYTLEPATNGKVVFDTDHGDIDVELWSKECPMACRNFVQLCLDGYYDGVIFHRILENFLVQTGDPTGTGQGGSAAGDPFKTEVHGRLRFAHRGLVAMAADGPDGMNESQFFFTLAATPELEKKHTIFGKVTGHTIYNVIKISELECDDDERPLEPPVIRSCEVVDNPFPDVVARAAAVTDPACEPVEAPVPSKNKKRGKKKDFNLLSFGDEAEEEETRDIAASKQIRTKSRPDLQDDPSLRPGKPRSKSSDPLSPKSTPDNQTQANAGAAKATGAASDGEVDEEKMVQERLEARKRALKEEKRQLIADLKRGGADGTGRGCNRGEGDTEPGASTPGDAASTEAASFLSAEREKYKSRAAGITGKSREAEAMKLLAQFKNNLDKGTDSMDWVPKEGLNFSSNDVNFIPNHTDTLEYDIVDPRNRVLKRVRESEKKKKKHSKKRKL